MLQRRAVDLVVRAIVPIVLLLALGWLLRHRMLRDEGFWRGLEWLSYYLFMPALFISSITGADLGAVSAGPLLVGLVVPVVAMTGIVLLLRRPLRADGPALTSLVQGSIRFNTYLGLVLVAALNGRDGIATFALVAAIMVPLVNIICVSLLSVHGDHGSAGVDSRPRPRLWRELVTNPLILSCLVALALNLLGLHLPGPIATTVDLIAEPALVCGTLVAGAAITLRVDRQDALPTPPTTYVLASRLGGDTRLMASLVGAQTCLAMLTLPVIVPLATSL